VRRSYLSSEEDAHSERSTLFSPSLSGRSAGEGREREALDTSTSSLNQSDFDDAVAAGWVPSHIKAARLSETATAATSSTAATSTEVHGDIDDADNEDAESADN